MVRTGLVFCCLLLLGAPSAVADAVQDAIAILRDPVPARRVQAAEALERLGDARAAEPLALRLRIETDSGAKVALALALGATGAPRHVSVLAPVAMTDPMPSVRAAAVTAVGDLGGPLARTTAREVVCKPRMPDPDWSVRAAGMLALAKCGHADDAGHVLTAFREGRGEAHWFARAALARFVAVRDRDPLPVLRQLVVDPDPRVAVTAAVGIAQTGHLQEVLLLLRHTSPTVRAAGATAVGRELVVGAYPRLRSLARFDASRRVRWASALALFRCGDPEGDEYMLQGLASREPTVWAEALAALGQRTGENHGRNVAAWREVLRRRRAGR